MDQDVKQYTIDLNLPTLTNVQDLQVKSRIKLQMEIINQQ